MIIWAGPGGPPKSTLWEITSTYSAGALDQNSIIMLIPPLEDDTQEEVLIGFFVSWVSKDKHSPVLHDCELRDRTCHIPFCQVAEKINQRQSVEGTWCPWLTKTTSVEPLPEILRRVVSFFLLFKMWSYVAQFQLSPAAFSAHTWLPSSSLLQSTCHLDFFQCCLQKVATAEPSCHG